MPLYMDIHTVDSEEFSAEDVVKAHMEDLAVQDKFGVKQLKYWVNENAKTIFCLMEGPNKDACNQVHLESHGNTACNIIEVADNEYNLFMGQGVAVNDLAKTNSGALDPGYRTILLTNIVCFSQNSNGYFGKIKDLVIEHSGAIVREPTNQIMVTFMYATDAISCASLIMELLVSASSKLEFNLAVVSGNPIDEEGTAFFEETLSKINSLCSLGLNKKLYLDKETIALSEKELQVQKEKQTNFTIVDNDDFAFSRILYTTINKHFTQSDFNSEELISKIGMSKSKASRKTKLLTGQAPNQLIQESRLQRALGKMSQSYRTIAEIAYESGFNSPSYFTRVFKKRFDIPPTEFIKHLN
ncbi:MAG: nickel-binding protein [Maribacter arcticus]|uniref:nickel-binding protein n=1 Tax=Maribacter arcticus TaxID=561365 RepID=UPI003001EBA9